MHRALSPLKEPYAAVMVSDHSPPAPCAIR